MVTPVVLQSVDLRRFIDDNVEAVADRERRPRQAAILGA
jgi:hypothetical protein